MSLTLRSLFLILLLVTFSAKGQKPLPLIQDSKTFMEDEMLGAVYDIEVGNNGHIYFTAGSTIMKCNGYTAEPLNMDITSRPIVKLYKDFYGQIWFSRHGGEIGYLREDRIIDCPIPDSLKKKGKYGYENLYRDSSGVLHIAPLYMGYYTLDHGVIRKENRASDINGYVIAQLNDGHLFQYSNRVESDSVFIYYQDSVGEIQKVCYASDRMSHYPSALVSHADSSMSLSIGGHSIFRINKEKLIDHHVFDHRVMNLFSDSRNNLWIGTIDNGFYKAENSDLARLDSFLEGKGATVVAEGMDGALWFNAEKYPKIGRVLSPSVVYYNAESQFPMFSHILSVEPYGDSLIIKNQNSDLFILFRDHIKELALPEIEHIEGTESRRDLPGLIRYNAIKKELWIGYAGVLHRWNGKQWDILKFNDTLFKDSRVSALKVLADGSLLGATVRQVFEVKNDELIPLSDYGGRKIRTVEMSPSGELWVSGDDGVWILQDGEFKRPRNDLPDLFYARFTGLVNALGKMWLYRSDGDLCYFENNEAKIIVSDQEHGTGIRAHFVQENGDLWFLSELHQKMIKVSQEGNELSVEQFYFDRFTNTGFLKNIFSVKDKKIYLGTSDGLSVLEKDELKKQEMPVRSSIAEIRINHKRVPQREMYELPYDKNNLNISFEAISFYGLPIHYLYQLENQDSTWVKSEYTHVQYTNLAPGTYNFRVKAGIPYNGWSEAKVITFKIAKPYWETLWYRGGVASCILILIGFVYRMRMRQNRRKRKLQFELNQNKQVALRKSMNPHFIFNSLNSIQRFVIQNDLTKANKFIASFGHLMRDYLEVSLRETISIREEMEIIDRYVRLEEVRMKAPINLFYSVDNKIDAENLMLPSFILQPFIENAIWHGLSEKKDVRRIELKFSLKDEKLNVQIIDNGIGISKDDTEEQTHSTGIFLKRQELLSKQYNDQFEFKRKNVQNEAGNNIGCIVQLTLPKIIRSERISS